MKGRGLSLGNRNYNSNKTLIIRIHTQAVQTRTEEILIKHENLIITDDVQSTCVLIEYCQVLSRSIYSWLYVHVHDSYRQTAINLSIYNIANTACLYCSSRCLVPNKVIYFIAQSVGIQW